MSAVTREQVAIEATADTLAELDYGEGAGLEEIVRWNHDINDVTDTATLRALVTMVERGQAYSTATGRYALVGEEGRR